MGGWLQSRNVRKFFRQKLAVAALAVVLVYVLTAAAVMLGAISTADTDRIVGPRNYPGFLEAVQPEKQLELADELFERVELALKKSDPAAALAKIEYGRARIAELPAAEIQSLVARGWKINEQLADEVDLDRLQLRPKLDELQAVVDTLLPAPAGWNGIAYRAQLLLGTDRQGRSIFVRAVYSTKVAIQVGLVTALASVLIGSFLGAAAGYFGGWVDHAVIWLYSTLSSIPGIVLLVLIVYVFTGNPLTQYFPLFPVYVAFIATFWIGPCRVIRGETLKLKQMEYIEAATAAGFGRMRILLRHILPNAAHLMLINFSLLFVGAIKSEVILSFLGLGVKKQPSWGIMISQSGWEVVTGFFWQIGVATAFMFVLVLAFNILSDALQDAFDPKHAG